MTGRPSSFTQEIGDSICERIAVGESLRAICRDETMPAMSTVFRWLSINLPFQEQYTRAREEQAETLADEIVAISDEADATVKHEGEEVRLALDATAVARNRLRVDTRKWVASKLKPKKYGERVQQEISGPNGGPVEHDVTHRLPDAAQGLLDRITGRAEAGRPAIPVQD